MGLPYKWGSAGGRSDLSGNAPGYDCSGFVSQFYHQMDRSIPAQTASAYSATAHLDEADARPGDIVEFNMNSNDPHQQHIAIYLGGGKVLQSGGLQDNVNIGNVNQFGAGTYEFRRASGGPANTDTAATSNVASTASAAAPSAASSSPTGSDSAQGAASAPSSPVVDPLAAAQSFKDSLGDPFAGAGQAIGGAASAVGTGAQDALQQAQAFKDSLGNPFASATTDTTAAPQTNPVGDAIGGAANALGSALPDLGSGLQSDSYAGSPVAQQAAGQVVPPGQVADQASQGLADTLMPGDGPIPVVKGALSAALSPKWISGGADAAPMQLATDAVAPIVGAVARPLADAAVSAGMGALDRLSPPAVAYAESQTGHAVQIAQDAVDALRARFPQMSDGSVAASAQGKDLAAAQAAHAESAAPAAGEGISPATPTDAASPTAAAPQTTDVMQGLLDMLRQTGQHDPAQLDALQSQIDALKPETAVDNAVTAPASADASAPSPTTPTVLDQSANNGVPSGTTNRWNEWFDNGRVGPEPPRGIREANPPQLVNPDGTLAPGNEQIPGKAGGAVEPDWMRISNQAVTETRDGTLPRPSNSAAKPADPMPSKIISDGGPTDAPTDLGPAPASRFNPDDIQAAHERIDQAGLGVAKTDAAHAQLDQMLSDNASTGDLARFMFTDVEHKSAGLLDQLRAIRTNSLAGGITTGGKVAMSPIIQTVMRAPVAALRQIVTGHPENVAKGMQAGIASLAQSATDGLQIMRHGMTDSEALTGNTAGGYGLSPGLDVLGTNKFTRALGVAESGVMRTHSVIANTSSNIGKSAALATGATPEDAAEVGQQWAMRSGNYGSTGQFVQESLSRLRQANPLFDVVGQVLVPMFRVGYNAETQGIERSPVGLLGTVADVVRAKFPESFGPAIRGPYASGADASRVTPVGQRLANNMFGIGLAAAGFAGAVNSNITGESPQGGDPKWSVRVPLKAQIPLGLENFAKRDSVGNLWIPLRAFGPAQEALAQGAALYEGIRDGKGDIPAIAAKTAQAYAGHVYDESWIRNVEDGLRLAAEVTHVLPPGSRRAAAANSDVAYNGTNDEKSFIPYGTLGSQLQTMTGLKAPSEIAGVKVPFTAPSSSAAAVPYTRPTRASLVPARPNAHKP